MNVYSQAIVELLEAAEKFSTDDARLYAAIHAVKKLLQENEILLRTRSIYAPNTIS